MKQPSALRMILREYKILYHSWVPWFRYTSSWREVRKQALVRDKYTCQASGLKVLKGAHVHHLNGAATHWKERLTLDNLITLHEWYHKDKWYSFHTWMGGTRVPCTRQDFFKWKRWLRKQRIN